MIIITREKDKDMFIKFAEDHNKRLEIVRATLSAELDPAVVDLVIKYAKIYSAGCNKWDMFIKYREDFEHGK